MNKLALVAATVIAQALCCRGFALESPTNPARQVISLDGDWLFQRDGAKSDNWKTISVPAGFDQHEGIDFHGVGWYRKVIPAFPLPAGKRVLLHFQAAATEAEVWWNGRRVGTHLGGWTPFRCDITEDVRKAAAGRPHELRVRLDEKVGHNTQGFLPIIAPHFGGLWQDVQLLVVPETYCDNLNLLAVGNLKTCEIQLDIPLCGKLPVAEEPVRFRCRFARPGGLVHAATANHLCERPASSVGQADQSPPLVARRAEFVRSRAYHRRQERRSSLHARRFSHDRGIWPGVATQRPAVASPRRAQLGLLAAASRRRIRARRFGGRRSKWPNAAASTR